MFASFENAFTRKKSYFPVIVVLADVCNLQQQTAGLK